MTLTPEKPKRNLLLVETGAVIGRLTVGDLARDIQHHPLLTETPLGYLRQGRLRECVCKCGEIRLIPEVILASGRVKSCGCLRREIVTKAAEAKLVSVQAREEYRSIGNEIKKLQLQLRIQKVTDVRRRDEGLMQEIGSRLRELFTKRQELQNILRRVKN